MKKMKNRFKSSLLIFTLTVGCSMMHALSCSAQDTFVYKGTVEDSVTRKALSNVRIYVDKDTVAVKSSAAGVFRVTVKKGSKVRFRKTGYRWLNMEIAGRDAGKVVMFPSAPNGMSKDFDAIEVDGKLLPKEEWNDINDTYISDLSVLNSDDKKVKLIIRTK
jgi:hypothetical protein